MLLFLFLSFKIKLIFKDLSDDLDKKECLQLL